MTIHRTKRFNLLTIISNKDHQDITQKGVLGQLLKIDTKIINKMKFCLKYLMKRGTMKITPILKQFKISIATIKIKEDTIVFKNK